MGKLESQTLSRRALFAGIHGVPIRPPWSSETSIKNTCTGCGDCIAACPESILFSGPANTPVVSFESAECTFCQACVNACDQPVFDVSKPAWTIQATISDSCILNMGISCRLCTDSCETEALVFDPSQRPVGRVSVDQDSCTGCGACVAACTFSAISVQEAHT